MPNTIAKFKKYVPLLDEVFKKAALSSVLDSDASIAKEGTNVNEILIPMMDMDGLGDYDRTKDNAYASGSVSLTMQTKKFNYERGRMFTVDYIDDEESAGLAYGKLASEFIRTKVVPEVDAVRFAHVVAKTVAAHRAVNATFADGKALMTALTAAMTVMDEAEVPQEQRYLFLTPALHNLVAGMQMRATRLNASFTSTGMQSGLTA